MSFELYIAKRYLLARQKQAFISVISLISILGVGLGVASLIVVVGVMNGFSLELRDKILGINAHMVASVAGGALHDYREDMKKAEAVPGVLGATPFVYTEVMLSSPRGVKGVVLRGVDPASAGKVLALPAEMTAGKLEDLTAPGLFPGIIVGRELADRLGLALGDTLNLMSPAGKESAAGFSPKVKTFTICGLFKTGMYEYDSTLAYVSIPAAQELLGFKRDIVTGLELKVADVDAVDTLAPLVRTAMGGPPVYVRTWIDMNGNLFKALHLEKTAMFVILVMIVLVGSFSIITTLVMLVMEKTRDIAILMSMGATAKNIRNIFMLQGTIIGFVGTALGYGLGLGVALSLEKYQFIKIPGDVYPMDHLPVRLDWPDLAVIGLTALALCFLATLYPARQASRLEPAEALRHD
ncbi:lipoprotein releasing system, transmembrane protein, LolC/E family [Solidesulfovibrio carbinoliphilus subsp. oakridgensis]|uniref:Lipoprotein releasing system, transmembrane protein, LolC/E family n=1 Tax=Solidesulfovibrio carbinoliphilus subsp. oakridgensis TaxID=694327 RepID=G7Q5G6_9BACT|nr:lipoprotein-releasing ABC transporter permease subunit [Solidesulfovibrio carbinoliphilus]EHJ48967.1 lipoprotein releasing system, transmembrane protein, LolC/E family [Solidesulfovibrio carbinoliphilus subsp. oakridgensis]